ncbi:MAG: hypothetical protein ABIP64_05495 [Burkholderiales bacterium]
MNLFCAVGIVTLMGWIPTLIGSPSERAQGAAEAAKPAAAKGPA